MNDLRMLAIIVGGAIGLLSLPFILSPGKTGEWIKDFPRSKFMAWILTAIGITWVTWLLFKTPLAWFDNYKPSLYVLAPLFFMLMVNFMDDLLAPRALGGLLILIPGPIIDIARQRGLLLVSLAYLLVIIGIMLVLSPYLFRKFMASWVENRTRSRIFGVVGLGLGVLMAVFGLLFY
ncbi:MAG: hypothetical protein PHR77_20105 [Kiritimatiellae bacterium]|nr:hypothetical protein [Kiritimatiellia bacterium]MDD5520827.1 hypothetical protein [Kiritimatiellia bacterium]